MELQIQGDECRRDQHDGAVEMKFGVPEKRLRVTFEEPVVQGEIHPGDEHEEDNDNLDVEAVEMGDARIIVSEPARRHAGEGGRSGRHLGRVAL